MKLLKGPQRIRCSGLAFRQEEQRDVISPYTSAHTRTERKRKRAIDWKPRSEGGPYKLLNLLWPVFREKNLMEPYFGAGYAYSGDPFWLETFNLAGINRTDDY